MKQHNSPISQNQQYRFLSNEIEITKTESSHDFSKLQEVLMKEMFACLQSLRNLVK